MTDPRFVEGVPWWRFRITYRLRDGRRRRLFRWSPGAPWVRGEIARELDDRHGLEAIAPGSVRINYA